MSLSAIFPANPAAAAVAAAVVDYANSSSAPVRVAVKVTRSAEAAVVSATDGTVRVCGDVAAGRLVAKAAGLYPKDDSHATETEMWADLAVAVLVAGDATDSLPALDEVLLFRTFLVGYALSFADIALGAAIRAVRPDTLPPSVARWMRLIPGSAPAVVAPVADRAAAKGGKGGKGGKAAKGGKADQKGKAGKGGKADKNAAKGKAAAGAGAGAGAGSGAGKKKTGAKKAVLRDLPDAVPGEVITRFPPEPSGYLHIGHAKALIVNDGYARKYDGKLLVRFDDTNPSKETSEFSEAILEDIKRLDITVDFMSHTSDHFDVIIEFARKFILDGFGYMDNTPVEQMRKERGEGIDSKYIDTAPDVNLARFEAMLAGEATDWCLRARMGNMKNPNKCMRDPVMFRSNAVPHVRTGTRYKAYPTYDFACPIVDAIEGVTHALRTLEYRDRDPQYQWVAKKLGVREVHVVEFARLNFQYTLLSKRKLQWFVDQGRVESWFDPRFPTIQGILRRGCTVEALKMFMLQQGASRRNTDMEWDKFWVQNRRVLDPISPRFSAIAADTRVRLHLTGEGIPDTPSATNVPCFPKDPDGPQKLMVLSQHVWLEGDDANESVEGEEVTLRHIGNVIFTKVAKDADGKVTELAAKTNPAGLPKNTKRKITWVADTPDTISVELVEFDHLLTKPHLTEEEESHFQDFITPVTRASSMAIGEGGLRNVNVGDTVQIERRGFFRCDRAYRSNDTPLVLFNVPDGKTKAMSTLSTKLAHR